MKQNRIITRTSCSLLLAGVWLLATGLHAAPLTWNNGAETMRWNTSEANFTGSAFTAGDGVTFGTTGAGSVYIGSDGPVPTDVAPVSTAITGGTYTFSGGGITSGSYSQSGSSTVTFSGYTNNLTFGGGSTLSAGTLTFNPPTAGNYGFGSGVITVSGGSFNLVGPTTGSTTLTNNISLGAATVLWGVGSATANPAIFSGEITLTGNPTFGNAHAYQPRRPLQLTGTIDLNGADRTISSWNEVARATVPQILGNVTGGGTRSLNLGVNWIGRGILIGGNGGWNIKNLNVGIQEIWVSPAADSTDFFSGIRANGGKVTIAQPQSGPGVMHLQGGAYHLDDFQPANTARVNVDLSSGRTVNIVGGTLNATNNRNGLWLTPGNGTLAGDLTVGGNGVLRSIHTSVAGTVTTKYGAGDDSLRLLGGSVYEVVTGAGDWNSQVRLTLQAQNAGDSLCLGDGDVGTAEAVTFRGSCNVPYSAATPIRGFIIQFADSQIADDGNVVLRYETPASNPWIATTSLAAAGGYNSTDRLTVGWSDRTSSTIQYPFRGGSAGTEFVPRVAEVAALGPTAGTVFTATNAVRLLATGLAGFYNSTVNMDVGALGPVVVDDGGSLLTVSNGTLSASAFTVNDGGALGGIGTFNATAITLNAGATVDVGNADLAGDLRLTHSATCNLTVNGAATLAIDVFGDGAVAGVDYDRLAVKSTVTGLANLDLVVRFKQDKLNLTDQTLTILTTSSDLTGQAFNSVTFENSYRGTVNYGNGFVSLSNVLQPAKGTTILVR